MIFFYRILSDFFVEVLILFSFSASFFFGKSRSSTLKFYIGNKSTAQHRPIDLVWAAFLCSLAITWGSCCYCSILLIEELKV